MNNLVFLYLKVKSDIEFYATKNKKYNNLVNKTKKSLNEIKQTQ